MKSIDMLYFRVTRKVKGNEGISVAKIVVPTRTENKKLPPNIKVFIVSSLSKERNHTKCYGI